MTYRIVLLLTCAILATAAHAQEVHIGKTVKVGGDVRISEPVDGSLHVAGGNIRVDAPVKGNVRAAGGKIVIDAPIGGDVSVAGGTLELGPNARIAGKLKFRGGELIRDPAAEVVGAVDQASGRKHRHDFTTGERFMRGWFWTFGLIVLAAIVAAALPGPSRRMAQELRERPWMTPLLGFVALTAIPVAAVLMMITIIGIPLGLLAFMGYAALLLLGYVWLSVVVGGLLLDRLNAETAAQTAWRVGAAVVAMLVLAVLVRIPILGGVVTFAAIVVGVGMIVGAIMRRKSPSPVAGAAA